MTSHKLILSLFAVSLCALYAGVSPARAGSSHARIIRLSLIQGDVRFARDAHGDPLTDSKTLWETAELNLPIREGYVLATDNGRAEVEFENGAMAFLNQNTVLEFYDLSLDDGARTTRLVLRQGSASFYVNPARGDYFSVTGGDFTVEAGERTSFRLDNYDDGSTVETQLGHLNVLRKNKTTRLAKGQSLSIKAGNDSSMSVGRLPTEDDFDRWVSGRIDTVNTATNAALQYTSSPYYTAGFDDLYTYGSWLPVGGYGYGWRPYGAGLGWCPFDNGGWFFDSLYGWSFMGSQPWGWAPYHFGSWIFDPLFGWAWIPGGFGYGGYSSWMPVTGRFVRGNGGLIGVVPVHPLDVRNKTPLNLAKGVFPVSGNRVLPPVETASAAAWKTLKSPPREALTSRMAPAAPPARVSRTVLSGSTASRSVTIGRDSSIAYDPREHRFVNNNNNAPATSSFSANGKEFRTENGQTGFRTSGGAVPARGATTTAGVPSAPRSVTPPRPPSAMVPPPAPSRSYGGFGGGRGGSSGEYGGGSRGGGMYSGGESGRSSSAGASHPSSGGGGGRPH